MQFGQLSRLFIFLGICLVSIGLLFWAAEKITWIKNLPGTLRINVGGLIYVFPILASILLSILMTVLINIIGRMMNR